MVGPADRDDELVAHPASECARLCEGEVMRIRRHAAAHKACLPEYESPVVLIAQTNRFYPKHRTKSLARLLLGGAHRLCSWYRDCHAHGTSLWSATVGGSGGAIRHLGRGRRIRRISPRESIVIDRGEASPEIAPPPFWRLPLSACSWQADSDAPRQPPRRPSLSPPVAQSGFREDLPITVLRGRTLPKTLDSFRSLSALFALPQLAHSTGLRDPAVAAALLRELGSAPRSGASRSSSPAMPTSVKSAYRRA